MSEVPTDHADEPLAELLESIYYGDASPDAVALLEQAMGNNQALRRRVLLWNHQEALLAWELLETAPAPLPSWAAPDRVSPAVVRPRIQVSCWLMSPQFLSLIVAALFVAVVVLSLAVLDFPKPAPPAKPAAESQLVARLSNASGAAWANEQSAPQFFRRGERWELTRGIVEVELFHGAKVNVEAPAKFYFTDDNSITLQHGAVYCYVPPEATGFRLATPAVVLVDLGTAFGVTVEEDGGTDFWMFTGLVHAHPAAAAPKSPPLVLSSGASGRFETGRADMLASEVGPERFPSSLTHSARRQIDAANLVSNGGFADISPRGLEAFAADYGCDGARLDQPWGALRKEGRYILSANPQSSVSAWPAMRSFDGDGVMLAADGFSTGSADRAFWRQRIELEKDQEYAFCFAAARLYQDHPVSFEVWVGGDMIARHDIGQRLVGRWQWLCANFVAPAAGEAAFEIRQVTDLKGGVDFAIDAVSLRPAATQQERGRPDREKP